MAAVRRRSIERPPALGFSRSAAAGGIDAVTLCGPRARAFAARLAALSSGCRNSMECAHARGSQFEFAASLREGSGSFEKGRHSTCGCVVCLKCGLWVPLFTPIFLGLVYLGSTPYDCICGAKQSPKYAIN